jgi:hypothetical protein
LSQPSLPTIAEAVKALKAYVRKLKKRSDVVLTSEFIGEKASAKELRAYQQRPDEFAPDLLALYAQMNGVEVAWQFVGDEDLGGQLYIPRLGEEMALRAADWPWFSGEPGEEEPVEEGEEKVFCFFDQMQPEYGTWLVADNTRSLATTRLVYLGHKSETGDVLPYSIADYLLQAVAHSFVWGWPRAVSDEDVRAAIERVQAPPPRPGKVSARRRLYNQYLADPWRLVRLGQTESWTTAVRHMALVWGPFNNSSSCGYWDGSDVVAHLLSPLTLPDTVALVQALVSGLESAREALPAEMVIPENERGLAYSPSEWRRFNWTRNWHGLLYPLLTGLLARVMEEPQAGRGAVPSTAIDDLEATNRTQYWGPPVEFAHLRQLLAGQNVMLTGGANEPWPMEPLRYYR